jgi:hypothetical protein
MLKQVVLEVVDTVTRSGRYVEDLIELAVFLDFSNQGVELSPVLHQIDFIQHKGFHEVFVVSVRFQSPD